MTTLAQTDTPWRNDATVIGLVGLAHASSHFSHLLLPLMFPVFGKTFGLSYSEMGLLMSVFFVVSGIGQASAGFVVDRFGARPVMFVSVAIMAVACLVASVATNYAGLDVGCRHAGHRQLFVSSGGLHHPQPKSVGPALGLCLQCAHGLTGNLGWAIAPVFMVSLSTWFDWRAAYVGCRFVFLGHLGCW